MVDLQAAREYTWDAAGNRLTIRLKPAEAPKPKAAPPAQPLTVPTFRRACSPGSSRQSAIDRCAGHGGQPYRIRVFRDCSQRDGDPAHRPRRRSACVPGEHGFGDRFQERTGVVAGDEHGRARDALPLGPSSDSVLTPDFRILLAGPGDFDYAISSNSRGDTCVRALLGNTASVIVSELMGDRSYQVKPTEQVVFHNGKIDR